MAQDDDDFDNSMFAINEKFAKGSQRMERIERDLVEATSELKRVRQDYQDLNGQLQDLLDFFNAMRGALKVLNWLGKLAKPMAYLIMLGSAVVGLWTAVKTGVAR